MATKTKTISKPVTSSYVVEGATLKCSLGTSLGDLELPVGHSQFIHNKKKANVSDHQPSNITPFGSCRRQQSSLPGLQLQPLTIISFPASPPGPGAPSLQPCTPNVTLDWINGKQTVYLDNHPALLSTSITVCNYGGLITIVDDGQDKPKAEPRRVITRNDSLTMRSSPNGAAIGLIPKGAEVSYTPDGSVNKTKYINGHQWARVTYNGVTGWVAADYLGMSKPKQEQKQAKNTGNGFSNYGITLEAMLDKQMKLNPQTQSGGRWVNASRDEVLKYLDPNNYNTNVNKYQFLDLSAIAGVSAADMGKFLEGKGILAGKENTYLEAARKYNVSEVYLAAHSALETGNGTSQLATGVVVNGVTVYNMYGINAVDSDPIGGGSRYAYKMGWDTPEKAIDGGAQWISEQYINNAQYQQNTLYKMRWNPASPGNHQYASDIGWAVKQTTSMKNLYDNFPNATLNFDMPAYQQ